MKPLILTIILYLISSQVVFGLGEDQLYTGSAATIQSGKFQYQTYVNTTYAGGAFVSGNSLTYGASKRMDMRVAYGYLWNDYGPNVQIGPNVGAKWRFQGNGRTNTSMALSALYGISNASAGNPQRENLGILYIAQQPTKYATLLANAGYVWVSNNPTNLRYLALAAAREVDPNLLLALQYVDIGVIGKGFSSQRKTQYVLGAVYHPTKALGCSLQLGYVPKGKRSNWTTTVGFAVIL